MAGLDGELRLDVGERDAELLGDALDLGPLGRRGAPSAAASRIKRRTTSTRSLALQSALSSR